MPSWMIYGANGFTGRLIAEEARRRGLTPTLGGRREEAIRPLAESLGLPWRAFPLDDAARVAAAVAPFDAVLLAAGPFSATSRPMVDACIATGTHYLDITGEIAVFEACHARDAEARKADCVVMPGVGFDVVPSDCLAATLKAALPDANRLELAMSGGGISRGTKKTLVEGFGHGGAIREGGTIRGVPFAWRSAQVPFRDKTRTCISFPWGDVSTAYYSTGIPNIMVYMSVPVALWVLKAARPFVPLMALAPVRRALIRRIERGPEGPDEAERRAGRAHLWGRVTNAGGRSVEATLETPDGYDLSVSAALECVRRILVDPIPPGAKTPSMAFGADLIRAIPGCDLALR